MKKSHISSKSRTNWERLDALEDEDIDLSDIPEITPEMFATAVVRRGLKPVAKKAQVTLRLDSDVLAWLKTQDSHYQARINALLRAYMDAHKQQAAPPGTHERETSALRPPAASPLSVS